MCQPTLPSVIANAIWAEKVKNICNFILPYSNVIPTHSGADGLSETDTLVNCEILCMFKRRHEPDRVFYLVRTIEESPTYVLLRIADAAPDSGYAKYMVIHTIAENEKEIKEVYEQTSCWASIL